MSTTTMIHFHNVHVHAYVDVDVKPFSSVPAIINHREAKPETETTNSDATKGQSVSYMWDIIERISLGSMVNKTNFENHNYCV